MTPHSRELAEYVDGLIEAQRETRGDYLTYGTPDPELVDIAALLRREPSVEEVARALCRAARIQQGFKDTPDYTLADEIDNAWDLWLPEAQAVAALWGREPG